MAHYAVISEGVVESVFVGVDETVSKGEIGGSTEAWEAYYESLPHLTGKTVRRCSYSGSFRKNYPAFGHTWDAVRNAFIPPKPYPSWDLNETTCRWESPVSMPESPGRWDWDEDTLSWVEA